MWIAQHPNGVWCAYKDKPTEKMGGWSGEIYSVISRTLFLINWRDTLLEISEKDYQDKFRHKEVV